MTEGRWTHSPLTLAPPRVSLSKESWRQDHATSGKPGWMQSRMIQSWRILEPRNLILLFPIRDAAPMSAAGFAGIAIKGAISYAVFCLKKKKNIIEQHFHADTND